MAKTPLQPQPIVSFANAGTNAATAAPMFTDW